ncbi:MAG: hypothetical protein HC828_06290, partial [Blastochloris sp.]|nr:hypothetical protein [Blastochloris sp.]
MAHDHAGDEILVRVAGEFDVHVAVHRGIGVLIGLDGRVVARRRAVLHAMLHLAHLALRHLPHHAALAHLAMGHLALRHRAAHRHLRRGLLG